MKRITELHLKEKNSKGEAKVLMAAGHTITPEVLEVDGVSLGVGFRIATGRHMEKSSFPWIPMHLVRDIYTADVKPEPTKGELQAVADKAAAEATGARPARSSRKPRRSDG